MSELEALTVLLLEDDETFAQVLQRAIQRAGHSLTWVATTAQLDEKLNQKEDFDLVLMDLKLAENTSLASISNVRARYPSAKIFIITGYASIATTVDAIKRGADDYLPKPITVDDILRAYYGDSESVAKVKEQPLSPKRLEWEHIQKVLQDNDGNISRTAVALNMHRRTLQRKLQKRPEQE